LWATVAKKKARVARLGLSVPQDKTIKTRWLMETDLLCGVREKPSNGIRHSGGLYSGAVSKSNKPDS
jgi:hypothetical protein